MGTAMTPDSFEIGVCTCGGSGPDVPQLPCPTCSHHIAKATHHDSPEIARLRQRERAGPVHDSLTTVLVSDLRYALALIDESCRSCAFVDEIRKQGERLTRMYDLFNEMMAQQLGQGSTADWSNR